MANDVWNPDQYHRFRRERSQPFHDLLGLVRQAPGMRVADLGCGTGELTAELHAKLAASSTIGIDSSEAMLAKAAPHAGTGLRFEKANIESWGEGEGEFDLVFSNAAFQWIDDHPHLFARVARAVAPGGQLAVQMPANFDQPSHRVAERLAGEPPFREALAGYRREPPVLPVDSYAALLHRLGFVEQHVRLQVYGHLLDSRDDVAEWVRGTLLTDYQKRLPGPRFDQFLERYRELLRRELADERPFFFPFKRILLWGMK